MPLAIVALDGTPARYSFGGRPLGLCSGTASFTPRRASASRSSTSICAFTLRNSYAAARSSASYSAGSSRNAKDFL